MRRVGGRRQNANFYALYLALNIIQNITQLKHKPPVTLALIALNSCIHYFPDFFHGILPYHIAVGNIRKVCLKPSEIVVAFNRHNRIDFTRIFGSALVHADDIHLMYNMGSLLSKGLSLENHLGSLRFLYAVLCLWGMSHSLMVFISYALLCIGYDAPFYSCSVGFSGVIFALKYLNCQLSPEQQTRIMNFNVVSKYATWVELILIQIIVPNASFLGHLSGILAGVFWVHFKLDKVYTKINRLFFRFGRLFQSFRRPRYTYQRGTANTDNRANNGGGNDRDEDSEVAEAIQRSLLDQEREIAHNDENILDPSWVDLSSQSQNELRRRRLNRFDG